MKTIIRIIQIIWGAFLFIVCIAPHNDFDKLEFWISLIILASIVLIPLQIIYQFLDKKDIRKQQALEYYNGIKTDVKTCPNCRCQVNKLAVVCPNCNFHFVDAYRNQTIQAPKYKKTEDIDIVCMAGNVKERMAGLWAGERNRSF